MDHEAIRHKLSEFIDGAVTPGEKAAIEQHLKDCFECADALAELRKTIEHIHLVEEVEAPAWMTQKIMAIVREEKGAETGLWKRVFSPFFMKFPVQAVAVLFLSVTVFYLYSSMHPEEKYAEPPMGHFAQQESHDRSRDALKQQAPEITGRREKTMSQKPSHKALDMKYEYEKPSPPMPEDRAIASAPAQGAKQPLASGKAEALGKRSTEPQATKRSLMAEQAAPAAGAVQRGKVKGDGARKKQKSGKSLPLDKEGDALLDITEHFIKVDLPQAMKKKGLQYYTRRFDTGFTDIEWMVRTEAFRTNACSNRYVVDVDFSGMLSKYLYCYDQSRIRLIGFYEFQRNTWHEMKP